MVNDDRTILRKINGQFRVYGTPWHGQGGFALAEDAPLKKIFILRQASVNQAERLSPAKAASALLVRTFAPLWDAPAMDFTLNFWTNCARLFPATSWDSSPIRARLISCDVCLPIKWF